MNTKSNPFGQSAPARIPAPTVLKKSFGIGIDNYDRGADVWVEDVKDKDGDSTGKAGWQHQPNETFECVIEFSTNVGKGTGRQKIPVSELGDYLDVLEDIIATDYAVPEKSDRTEYIPTNEVARQSFRMILPKIEGPEGKLVDDHSSPKNVVSVRCTGGKGAKPMTVPTDEFPQVVSLLRTIQGQLEDSVDDDGNVVPGLVTGCWDRYKAELASREAAEAEED